MIIWLVGFMGSGKSTVGGKLARLTGWDWLDTDDCISKERGKAIPVIFKEEGEPVFRELEAELFDDLSGRSGIIVSTGGGFPCHHGLMDKMKSCGRVFYLEYPAEVLAARLKSDAGSRPLLAGLSTEFEIMSAIRPLLSARDHEYRKAHHILEADPDPVKTIYDSMKSEWDQSR